MKKVNWYLLASCILSVVLVGLLSSLLAGNAAQIYSSFKKPPLSPTAGVFGIVWTILYILMGIALYIIFTSHSVLRQKALNIFALQLLVNFSWSIIFFRFDMLWAAAAVIILLDFLIVCTISIFYKISKIAGWLLVPYLIWILFATYLNIAFAVLN